MAMHQANREYSLIASFMAPVLLLVLVITGYMLAEIFDSLWFKPWLLAIGVFYWTLYLPITTPIWLALILGLLEDGLAGTPFGFYGLGILLMHYLTYYQRQSLIHSPFTVVATGFIINLFVVIMIMVCVMLIIGLPISWWVAVEWLVTSLMFLPIAYLFDNFRYKLMKD